MRTFDCLCGGTFYFLVNIHEKWHFVYAFFVFFVYELIYLPALFQRLQIAVKSNQPGFRCQQPNISLRTGVGVASLLITGNLWIPVTEHS